MMPILFGFVIVFAYLVLKEIYLTWTGKEDAFD